MSRLAFIPFRLVSLLAAVSAGAASGKDEDKAASPDPPPIRALLVTGGCSHDYATRREILVRGIRERISRPVEWKVHLEGLGESDVRIPLFESSDWTEGCDIVVHDHCFPRVDDSAYLDRILAPHDAGVPAVLIHGSMMSFRAGGDRWFGFTGATIRSHEREGSVLVTPFAEPHPLFEGFSPWAIPREELYRVESLVPGTAVLADAPDPSGMRHAVVWARVHGSAKARVFGTTLGNATATLADSRYLDLVARGFLWAVGEDSTASFRHVPPERSLQGLSLPPIPSEPPLRLGSNPALRGKADAFAWGDTVGSDMAALAVDGDPATAWRVSGPGTWRVTLRKKATVSVAAIVWQGAVPEEGLLESSEDGSSWRTLATLRPSGTEAPTILHFDPVVVSQLRLSVPKGAGFGLGEFAVYPSADALPAALRVVDPTKPRFRSVDREGAPVRVRLTEGWRVGGHIDWPAEDRIGQLVPTAAGGVFVSIFPVQGNDSNGRGRVLRLSPNPGGPFDSVEYLSDLDPAAQIAWDGEWLLILSGPRLDSVRRALGPGPADERRPTATVYSLPSDGAAPGFALSRLRVGGDGWLHAEVRAEAEGIVLDAEGRPVRVPRWGRARFQRDGRRLEIVAGDPAPPSDDLSDIAQVEELIATERDGGRIWIVAREGERLFLACLVRSDDAMEVGPVWDEVPSASLATWLAEGKRPSIRREAALEILRRKQDPVSSLDRLLSGSASGSAEELVTVAAGLGGGKSLDRLLHLSTLPDPALRAAAYRAIGNHPGARDHPAFAEIGRTTEPRVTAALFAALQRSHSELPGAEELAFALASHSDPELAGAAFEFLRNREAVDAAFAVLDREDRREQWPSAFALLRSFRRPDVVEALIARLRRTGDPEWRRLGLETLCRLYPVDEPRAGADGKPISDFLREALGDHRVDRVALLTAMADAGLPVPDAESLVRLARQDLSLDAFAIASLLGAGSPLSSETLSWLEQVWQDRSRDGDLRLRALALLARYAPSGEYRLRFRETALRRSIRATGGASFSLARENWLAREDHGANSDWLRMQAKGGEGELRQLAEETLVASGAMEEPGGKAPGTVSGGRDLFRSLACDACHNLHGEGPSFGPDLHVTVFALSDDELAEALLHPDRRISPGYEVRRLERKDGLPLVGRIESRSAATLVLGDRAGNRLELPDEEIAHEWPETEGRPGCEAATELSEPEFAALLAFLRSLGGTPGIR